MNMRLLCDFPESNHVRQDKEDVEDVNDKLFHADVVQAHQGKRGGKWGDGS